MQSLLATVRDTVLGYRWWMRERVWPPRPDPAQATDRRILIFVTGFPPDVSGGAYRPAALARYAERNGWIPTVVSFAAPARPSAAGLALLEYAGSELTVLRTADPPVEPSYRLFPKVDGMMIRALEMARLARAHFGADLPRTIFCSGPSFSPFVAGWFLTRGTDRKLVLEYRDEWTLCPFDFVSKEAHDRAWELRCLRRADLVITMTDSQREALMSHFGGFFQMPPVDVVANGWEPAFSDGIPQGESKGAADKAIVTFAGKLGDYTHPGRFLAALESVLRKRPDLAQRLEVRFVGMKDPGAQEHLARFPVAGVVRSVEPVPQSVAARMMRESRALLLIHNPDFERYIPGKIYEYAASGVPILLFDDIGESDRIVRELNLGHSLRSEDHVGLERALERICAGAPEEASAVEPRTRWLDRHRREALSAQMYRLLEQRLRLD
jgi:glycosyltransferase involved in cell wall biosynthesis